MKRILVFSLASLVSGACVVHHHHHHSSTFRTSGAYYEYWDPHPIPDTGSWCAMQGHHEHRYIISSARYPVVLVRNHFVFVGDPYLWGWPGPIHWYWGHHPYYAEAWCVLDGGHTHWYRYTSYSGHYAWWGSYGGYAYYHGYRDGYYQAWHEAHYHHLNDHHETAGRRWYSDHSRNPPLNESPDRSSFRYDRAVAERVMAGKRADDPSMPLDAVAVAALHPDRFELDPGRLPETAVRPDSTFRAGAKDDGTRPRSELRGETWDDSLPPATITIHGDGPESGSVQWNRRGTDDSSAEPAPLPPADPRAAPEDFRREPPPPIYREVPPPVHTRDAPPPPPSSRDLRPPPSRSTEPAPSRSTQPPPSRAPSSAPPPSRSTQPQPSRSQQPAPPPRRSPPPPPPSRSKSSGNGDTKDKDDSSKKSDRKR